MACVLNNEFLSTCPEKPKGGVYKYGQFYNYLEWRAMEDAGLITRDADGRITDIVNAVGVQAYRIDFTDETALVLGYPDRKVDGGVDGYDHTVNMSILGTKQEQKNALLAMANEGVVAVFMKKNGTGEVYGDEQGLKSQTNTANPNAADIGAVIPVQLLTSPRVAPETRPPADVFKTDVSTTKALIEGLNVVGV